MRKNEYLDEYILLWFLNFQESEICYLDLNYKSSLFEAYDFERFDKIFVKLRRRNIF